MIPIRDNIPSRTTPYVNYAMLAVCTLVFFVQLSERRREGGLVERYGMVPARVWQPDEVVKIRTERLIRTSRGNFIKVAERPLAESAVPPIVTLLTCIFLHGGWMHFIGNMWFLHIFGDNVEDRFGHLGYLGFYLLTGIAASGTHLLTNASSPIPTIGASGAIAGVMGAYFLLYPRARVLTILPIFFFFEIIVVPAPVFLGIWFLIQFFQGAMSISSTGAGVAWWAHIGGFAAGLALVWLLKRRNHLRPAVDRVLPHTDRTTAYRLHSGRNPWSGS